MSEFLQLNNEQLVFGWQVVSLSSNLEVILCVDL